MRERLSLHSKSYIIAPMLSIHPTHPQPRLIEQAVSIVRQGGVIVYPTDSGYALGCALDSKQGIDQIRRIRQLDKQHLFTFMCRDLSELSKYARFDNVIFRLLKAYTPGPYTFIMEASKDVPKRFKLKRKTIGLRIPDHKVTLALLQALGEPLLSVSLVLDGDLPIANPEECEEHLEKVTNLVIDSGHCDIDPTTVVDLTKRPPVLIREGKGDASLFIGD